MSRKRQRQGKFKQIFFLLVSLGLLHLSYMPSVVCAAEVSTNTSNAKITAIDIRRRGSVAELVVKTSDRVSIKTTRRGAALIAVFQGSVSDIDFGEYIPKISPFKSLTLQKSRVRPDLIGLTVDFGEEMELIHSDVLVENSDRQLRITAPANESGSESHWSASPGKSSAYTEKIDDGKKAESPKPSAHQTLYPPENVNTFAVEENRTKLSDPLGAYSSVNNLQNGSKLVVAGRNVNFRSTPDTDSPGNIISQLNRGATGMFLEKRGTWYRMRLDDGIEGWIYASLVSTAPLKNALSDEPGPRDAGIDRVDASDAGSPEKKQEVAYRVYGRDPFIPLSDDEFSSAEFPDVGDLKLVGVLFDTDERVALFEDLNHENKPYALRERDGVKSGRVFRIQRESVVFLLNESGISHTYTLKLHKKQDN